MKTIELTAPAFWAPLLLAGDASAMTGDELRAAESWLITECLDEALDCRKGGFLRVHDAWEHWPYAEECLTYEFPWRA